MNTYYKFYPNVYLAKCPQSFEKGDIIQVTTKRGKENDCIVHNLIAEKGGFYYYSITRADGMDAQEYAKKKAGKLLGYSQSAKAKGEEYYQKSNKDRDFLVLGEPIKVGHHSERRHRKIIEQAHTNTGKWIEQEKKAEKYEDRAAYWLGRTDIINLSMPESIDYFAFKLEEATIKHEGIKNGSIPKEHAYSLTYAKKEVNEASKSLEIAKKLWS